MTLERRRQIVKPRPVPASARPAAKRSKGTKTRSWSAAAMPGPVSDTAKSATWLR